MLECLRSEAWRKPTGEDGARQRGPAAPPIIADRDCEAASHLRELRLPALDEHDGAADRLALEVVCPSEASPDEQALCGSGARVHKRSDQKLLVPHGQLRASVHEVFDWEGLQRNLVADCAELQREALGRATFRVVARGPAADALGEPLRVLEGAVA